MKNYDGDEIIFEVRDNDFDMEYFIELLITKDNGWTDKYSGYFTPDQAKEMIKELQGALETINFIKEV